MSEAWNDLVRVDKDAVARVLAEIYATHYRQIAELCDEHLDRSGGLLGKVRHEAAILRQTDPARDPINQPENIR